MMISVQIKEFKKSLNAVNSACDEVRCLQELNSNILFSPYIFLFLRLFLLIACSSGSYFTKAKRDYEKDSLSWEHIEPRNCEG